MVELALSIKGHRLAMSPGGGGTEGQKVVKLVKFTPQ